MNRSPADSDATLVVQLTPPGRAALAAILVAGPEATPALERAFACASGKPLAAAPLGRIVLGRWRATGEDVVVCRRSMNRIEIICHGGPAAVSAIRDTLLAAGCAAASADVRLENAESDTLAAAAWQALPHALTERTALVLLDQAQGALRRSIDAVARSLSAGNRPAAIEGLDRLLAVAPLGRHLTEPWRIVIVGPPNVGKSSLINALVGYGRAIVHGTPGTTRDVLTASTAFDGWPIELADTAGRREASDPIERGGQALADAHLAAADLVILAFDRSQPFSAEEARLADQWPGALIVHNKCDLLPAAGNRPIGLEISAVTGENLDRLQASAVERLVPIVPALADGVPFTAAQAAVLAQARRLAATGDVLAAGDCLQVL